MGRRSLVFITQFKVTKQPVLLYVPLTFCWIGNRFYSEHSLDNLISAVKNLTTYHSVVQLIFIFHHIYRLHQIKTRSTVAVKLAETL